MESFQQLINDAKKAGITVDTSTVSNDNSKSKLLLQLSPIDLCNFLGTIPIWCDDKTLHERNPDYQNTAICCTTHIVGLPRHPATNKEMPLTPYQIDLVNKVITGRKSFGDAEAQMRKALKMHIKKGRQMGFTEIVLRLILHLTFSRYAGSNIGIIAATNGSLAKKDLRRLALLFKSIPTVVEQWIKSNTLRIINGTAVEAFAASEEAMTGDTKYKAILVDESAKWRLVDDKPVFNSILPIVRTNGSDLYLVSTTKGPVKMFYKIDTDHDELDWRFFVYDIWETEGNLYTKPEIEEMLASSTEDPDQEYLCLYKSGRDSIFGTVSTEDQQGMTEWLSEEVEEEDDYDEKQDKDGIHWHEDKS